MESIVVDRVTKRFTLRHAHSIKEMTVRAARRQSLSERFTALDEVSVAVGQGESVALMGLNGSGKSTLLKLISGVMQADGGSVRVRGRVAGLIEVGAGLHPDLTGRENIFLNAAILGMTKAETAAKYDEIVAFSEIEKFLDTQVKFYSSGMFMRLGFAVAVHTDPDVFLVDEVLAVGDPPFQKKCLDRIERLHAEGRTLVIVSHDMGTLEKVCARGVVLRKGRVAFEGDIADAVDFLAPPDDPLDAARRRRAREEARLDAAIERDRAAVATAAALIDAAAGAASRATPVPATAATTGAATGPASGNGSASGTTRGAATEAASGAVSRSANGVAAPSATGSAGGAVTDAAAAAAGVTPGRATGSLDGPVHDATAGAASATVTGAVAPATNGAAPGSVNGSGRRAGTGSVAGAPESGAVPPEPAPASKRPAGRLRELDLLRFVAAAVVMLHHFTGVPAPEWPGGNARKIFPALGHVTRFGFLGVELFFLISGFVILMSAWNRRVGDFAVSRFVRLFPAYWVSVLLSLAAYLAFGSFVSFGPNTDGPLMRFLPNLTMLQEGVGSQRMEVVYWTLYVELHFYVLISLLVWRGITYSRCIAFMTGWLLLSVFALEANTGLVKVLLLWRYAPFFVAGMGFFLVYRYGGNLIVWLLIAAGWALGCYYDVKYNFPDFIVPGVSEYVIPAGVTLVFAVMALVATHRLAWLRWRGLTVLGMLTYPLYLVHQTIARTFVPRLYPHMSRWAVLAVLITAALTSSYLVYRLVELPAQRGLRVRLRNALAQIRRDGPPADAVAGAEASVGAKASMAVGPNVAGAGNAGAGPVATGGVPAGERETSGPAARPADGAAEPASS